MGSFFFLFVSFCLLFGFRDCCWPGLKIKKSPFCVLFIEKFFSFLLKQTKKFQKQLPPKTTQNENFRSSRSIKKSSLPPKTKKTKKHLYNKPKPRDTLCSCSFFFFLPTPTPKKQKKELRISC